MRQESLLALLAFNLYVEAQRVRSLSVNYSPFCVTDRNGNCQGFRQQKPVIYSAANRRGQPTVITLEKSGDSNLFTLEIEGNVPGGTLVGTIDGVNVTAPVNLRASPQGTVVTTRLARNFAYTAAPWALSGNITWVIGRTPLPEETPVQLYAVSQTAPQYFRLYGVYQEFLNFILPRNDGRGRLPQDTTAYNQYAGRRIHGDTKFKYDVYHGASHYYTNNKRMNSRDTTTEIQGWFSLRAWLNDRRLIGSSNVNGEVNCYDQAGLIQMALSLGPTPNEQINLAYADPYGYIKTTTLVGNIRTNSPFFRGNPQAQIVDARDRSRTAFGNHMFCAVGQIPQNPIGMSANQKSALRIFDSCAGPDVGTRTLPQYLSNAIDSVNARNSKVPGLENVKVGRGVTQFNNRLVRGNVIPHRLAKRQQTAIDNADAKGFENRLKAMSVQTGTDSGKVYRISFDRCDTQLGGEQQQHKILSKDSSMDGEKAIFSYLYRMNNNAEQDIRIRMTVAKDYQGAFLALNHTLGQMDAKLEDTFSAPPADSAASKNKGSLGSWTLFAKKASNKGGILFVEGNVMVDISGLAESTELEPTAKSIHDFITAPPAEAKNPGACQIGQFKLDGAQGSSTIEVGQSIKVAFNVKNVNQYDWQLKTGNALVTYMNQASEGSDTYEVEILGASEGAEEIIFSFMSPGGEVQNSQPLVIKVVPASGNTADGNAQPTGESNETEETPEPTASATDDSELYPEPTESLMATDAADYPEVTATA